jgi:hypothetical protein
MKTMKFKLGAATIALMAAGFGPSLAQAAPAIGAHSVANAAASSVETVHYRGRHYGYRRYGGGYGYRGRHWRHRHNGFPAGLIFGSILGFGDVYSPGYYGGPRYYGYGPGYYRGW